MNGIGIDVKQRVEEEITTQKDVLSTFDPHKRQQVVPSYRVSNVVVCQV